MQSLTLLLPELPLLVSLILKVAGAGIVWVAYIQFTGEFNLWLTFKEKILHRS